MSIEASLEANARGQETTCQGNIKEPNLQTDVDETKVLATWRHYESKVPNICKDLPPPQSGKLLLSSKASVLL